MTVLHVALTLVGAFVLYPLVLYIALISIAHLKERREAKEDFEDVSDADTAARLAFMLIPQIIELGNLPVYPRCPTCREEIRQVRIFWKNSKSADTGEVCGKLDLQFITCGECKSVIPGSYRFE